jgi:hypothetical protein
MTDDIVTGNNIMRYVVFDRNENPIELSASWCLFIEAWEGDPSAMMQYF